MTNFTLVTFSPTGNAAYLADLLAQQLDGHVMSPNSPWKRSRPLTYPPANTWCCYIPIHAFNAPRNVKQWVKDLPKGHSNTISLIAVGSGDVWFNEAVSLDLRKPLEANGYSIHVDAHLAMPVTMLVAVDTKTGQELVQTAEARITEIATALTDGATDVLQASTRARIMNTLGKAESLAARAFGLELHATDACTSCELCWTDCPMGNIKEGKDGKPRFGANCLMCLRCVYRCPTQAIKPRFSVFVPIKGGLPFRRLPQGYVECHPSALIAGGVSGIAGRTMALHLISEGWRVWVVMDIDETGLRDLTNTHPNIIPFVCDVTDTNRVRQVIAEVETSIGPVVRFMHCAAIMPGGLLHETSPEDITRVMQINYNGMVNTTQTVLPFMRKRQPGEFIVMGSVAGYVHQVKFGAYSATKAATKLLYDDPDAGECP